MNSELSLNNDSLTSWWWKGRCSQMASTVIVVASGIWVLLSLFGVPSVFLSLQANSRVTKRVVFSFSSCVWRRGKQEGAAKRVFSVLPFHL